MSNEVSQGIPEEEIFRKVSEAVKKIRYGSIEIVVHDSKIVQIECREKIRFDKK